MLRTLAALVAAALVSGAPEVPRRRRRHDRRAPRREEPRERFALRRADIQRARGARGSPERRLLPAHRPPADPADQHVEAGALRWCPHGAHHPRRHAGHRRGRTRRQRRLGVVQKQVATACRAGSRCTSRLTHRARPVPAPRRIVQPDTGGSRTGARCPVATSSVREGRVVARAAAPDRLKRRVLDQARALDTYGLCGTAAPGSSARPGRLTPRPLLARHRHHRPDRRETGIPGPVPEQGRDARSQGRRQVPRRRQAEVHDGVKGCRRGVPSDGSYFRFCLGDTIIFPVAIYNFTEHEFSLTSTEYTSDQDAVWEKVDPFG